MKESKFEPIDATRASTKHCRQHSTSRLFIETIILGWRCANGLDCFPDNCAYHIKQMQTLLGIRNADKTVMNLGDFVHNDREGLGFMVGFDKARLGALFQHSGHYTLR